MQLILTKKVDKLGNAGDIVNVSPGYGRNFLIAQGLAKEATNQAIQASMAAKRKKKQQKEKAEGQREKLKNMIAGQTILVRAQVGEEGQLFAGVTQQDIAAAIAKRRKVQVDPKTIVIPHNHIKTLGKHEVVVKLGGGDDLLVIVDVQASAS